MNSLVNGLKYKLYQLFEMLHQLQGMFYFVI